VGSGGRPESEIFAAAPVIEVVQAFKAGAGVIGDFIMDKTGSDEESAGLFVKFCLEVVGGEVIRGFKAKGCRFPARGSRLRSAADRGCEGLQ